MPNSVWRTSRTTPGRGGALVTAFDLDIVRQAGNDLNRSFVAKADELIDQVAILDREEEAFSGERMWNNYAYFVDAVMPVAEETGVKLALHPDDPPVPSLGGVARLFRNVEGFKRGAELANSPAWGIDLCLGCCSEMPGGAANVIEMVEHFGPRGQPSMSTSATSRNRPCIPGMLHRRRQLRSCRGHGRPQAGRIRRISAR